MQLALLSTKGRSAACGLSHARINHYSLDDVMLTTCTYTHSVSRERDEGRLWALRGGGLGQSLPVSVLHGKHAPVVQQLAEGAQVPGAQTAQRAKHKPQHSMPKAASDMSAHTPAFTSNFGKKRKVIHNTLTSFILFSRLQRQMLQASPQLCVSKRQYANIRKLVFDVPAQAQSKLQGSQHRCGAQQAETNQVVSPNLGALSPKP